MARAQKPMPMWVQEPGSETTTWTWWFNYYPRASKDNDGAIRVRLTVFDTRDDARGGRRMSWRGHCTVGNFEVFRVYRATRHGAQQALVLGLRKFLSETLYALRWVG